MKPYTKAVREKGLSLAALAKRWDLSLARVTQIAAAPTQLHQDALNGIPGDPADPYNFDDFEEIMAGRVPADVAAILLSAASKYRWTDPELLDLAEAITNLVRLSEATKRRNEKRKAAWAPLKPR